MVTNREKKGGNRKGAIQESNYKLYPMLYLMDTATRKLMLSEIFSSLYFTKGIIKKILGYSDSIYCIIDRKTLYSVTFIFTMSTSCSVTQKKDAIHFKCLLQWLFLKIENLVPSGFSEILHKAPCPEGPLPDHQALQNQLYGQMCQKFISQLLLRCCNKSRSSRSVVRHAGYWKKSKFLFFHIAVKFSKFYFTKDYDTFCLKKLTKLPSTCPHGILFHRVAVFFCFIVQNM